MTKLDPQSHIEFYKHISTIGLATFAGCIALMGAMDESSAPLITAAYLALASSIQSLYAMKVIITENRIPYSSSENLLKRLSRYSAYRLLIFSLFIIAVMILQPMYE